MLSTVLILVGMILNILFLILYVNLFDGIFVRKSRLTVFIGIVVFLCIALMQQTLDISEFYVYPLKLLVGILLVKYTYVTNIYESLYLSLLANLFSLLVKGIVIPIFALNTQLTCEGVMENRITYACVYITTQIVLISLVYIANKTFIGPNRHKPVYYKPDRFTHMLVELVLMSLLSSIIYVVGFQYATDVRLSLSIAFVFVLIGISVFFTSESFYMNWLDITELEHYKKDSKKIESKILENEEYYNQFNEEMNRFKELDHDYQKLVRAIKGNLSDEKEESDEKIKLFEDLSKEFESVNNINGKYSNNYVLDSLIKDMEMVCVKHDIELSGKIVMPYATRISTFELVRIASNILDNAVDANKTIKSGKRFIKFSTKYNGEWLSFYIQNAFDGSIKYQNNQLVTSKKDSRHHGLGLKIVDNIVTSWGGTMTLNPDVKTKTFTVKITLNLERIG